MDRLPNTLCERALKLTISWQAGLIGHCSRLPSQSLTGLYDLQIVEAAHVKTQLGESVKRRTNAYQNCYTHKCHQASHASSHDGNLYRKQFSFMLT